MLQRRLSLRLAALLLVLAPGAAWAACSSPSGLEGEMLYNHDFLTMQYCNGTVWVSIPPTHDPTMVASALCG